MKLFPAIAALTLLAAPAFADQPPAPAPIPWDHTFFDETGKPLPPDRCDVAPAPAANGVAAKPGEGCHDLTLKDVVIRALLVGDPDEKPSAELSGPHAALALKLMNDAKDVPVLNTEQRAVVKKLVGKRFPAMIYGQAFPLLFPGDDPGPIK